jgi:uncharacterized membrane protein YqaE (UPF0057 family)
MAFTASDICKIIFAVILPPLGVFLERGCGIDLFFNIILTLLGVSFYFIPPNPKHPFKPVFLLTNFFFFLVSPWNPPRAVHYPEVLEC